MTNPKILRIRELNDAFRTNWLTGTVLMTHDVCALPEATQSRIAEQVQKFDDFTPDNDPHGEHDFGALTVDGHRIFWKIDYCAPYSMRGSDNPSDPRVTWRMLTIMLAHEY